jgi:peptidoglycan/LPS O-acetylase OafA/YrhL
MNNRNLEIDTLRGMACIFLVAYHVIGSSAINGLKISEGVYRDFNDVLGYLRMPLFTFLSGIVYAYRPFRGDSKVFLIKKARRLLLPMLTVGTSFVCLQYLTPGSNKSIENWHLIHIIPVAHFWFIESLFILFVLIVFFEKKQYFDTTKSWGVIFLVASLFYVSSIDYIYFSFSGFLYLTPYFLAGMGIQRYNLIKHINRSVVLILVFSVITILTLIFMKLIPMYDRRTIPALFIGLIGCVTLLSLGFKSKILEKIGVFSYSIFLFHVFFTASSRIILNKVGVGLEVNFAISLAAGICGPIITEKILEKVNFSRVLCLGKAPLKN